MEGDLRSRAMVDGESERKRKYFVGSRVKTEYSSVEIMLFGKM